MVKIKGFQKTSLIDYHPYVASVLFVSGCNFRCPFCHNPDLVFGDSKIPTIEHEKILSYLQEKRKWVDGVCITGGEPCIYADLPEFIGELKKLGLLVKLDTNGTDPEMLQKLINEELIDYVAMDIKAPLDKYDEVVKTKVDKSAIKKSVKIIINSRTDYEFRCTVVPGLFDKEDAEYIANWLKGAKKFFIQQFRNNRGTLDPEYMKVKPFSKEKLEEFKEILGKTIEEVGVRG